MHLISNIIKRISKEHYVHYDEDINYSIANKKTLLFLILLF
jgi:hypothetical protein